MGLDIMLVKDVSVPYWEQKGVLRLGDIDPVEWEVLFYQDFQIKDFTDCAKEEGWDSQTYREYYMNAVLELKNKHPLISRIADFYSDAFFSKNEIRPLESEILNLMNVVKRKEARNLLKQLQEAAHAALANDAGLILVAD